MVLSNILMLKAIYTHLLCQLHESHSLGNTNIYLLEPFYSECGPWTSGIGII